MAGLSNHLTLFNFKFVLDLPGISKFQSDAETFAKAIEKFGKFLGKQVIAPSQPDFWKQVYEDFDLWFWTQGPERIVRICMAWLNKEDTKTSY